MASVEVRDLSVTRGENEVLHRVSFSLEPGQVVGLLGPSGCGKTTLMRTLVGVQRGVRGDVTVLGSPAGSAPLRHRIGYVTQSPAVYGDLTVKQNLRYFGALLGVYDVDPLLDRVSLRDKENQRVDRLSGGQRARVSLATALIGWPELLVLDEPTVGLDPVLRRDLWDMFRALAADGATLLVSSHVMDEAARCDRLLLMREGVIVADDTPAGLLKRTGTGDVEHAFLAIAEQAA